MPVRLLPPAPRLPDTREVLRCDLDPDLAAVFRTCDGGDVWKLALDGCSEASKTELIADNLSARRLMDEPLTEQLVIYAQYAYQAAHLCCVPSITTGDQFQSVVFADFNEAPIIKPIASRVDRAFGLIASYLHRLAQSGLPIDDAAAELTFPDAVADLIAEDQDLVAALSSLRFSKLTRHPASESFVDKILQATSKR